LFCGHINVKGYGLGIREKSMVTSGRSAASHVEVQIGCDGATKTLRPRWLVGCDGMHSRVREQSAIAFSGAEYEQSFVLADVHMDWPLGRDEVTLFYSPAGLAVVAPLPWKRGERPWR
jgi:2-polyprenyl-6-methoxyphenol hydroxylase-like FAD-dependent oxidoreductase